MEILILLVESRPNLVTREQIIEKAWGRDVFVDSDNSINGAIRKIRLALRDDPEKPRFIRTVTGMGYRFIAPVVEEETDPLPVAAPFPAISETPPPATPEPPAPIPTPMRKGFPLGRWGTLLVVLVAAGVAGIYLRWSHSPLGARPFGGRLMLAVLPFENLTGDSGQDYLSDGFTEEMITRLGTIAPQRLGVIARTSVMYYKQARIPLDRLGRELGVQYVLE